jgi:hypothetical protein
MKKVYICSPLRGDMQNNIANAQEYCREACANGVLPIAPHIYFTQFLNDLDPAQRKAGMEMGLEQLTDCSEIWVYGDISEGMAKEISIAKALGIAVVYKDGISPRR